jgi:hypothetical protein
MSTVPGIQTNKKMRPDPIPNIRPAGLNPTSEHESADYSIRQDVHNQAPGTPEHLKKFRKSHVN